MGEDYSKHMHAHTEEHTDYTKLNLHNLKQAANSDLRQTNIAAQVNLYFLTVSHKYQKLLVNANPDN